MYHFAANYLYMYIKIDCHLHTVYFNYLVFLFLELLITLVIWIYLENIQMEWIPPHPPPHQKSPSQQATSERWGFGSISMYLIIKNTCSKNLLKIIIFNKISFWDVFPFIVKLFEFSHCLFPSVDGYVSVLPVGGAFFCPHLCSLWGPHTRTT